ncbi:hypothetical protein EPO05_04130 [Patescibacteria group bacterium]|nr:MAG: hypothetical protein EPO05_04130 [Patescibacteria group bacterium]
MEKYEPIHHGSPPGMREISGEAADVIRLLHRGVWAGKLVNGQELPVGGSLFSDDLTIRLKLDFDSFEDQLGSFTAERIWDAYERNKKALIEWLHKAGSNIDPYVYYACYQAQMKMQQLLEFDPVVPTNSSERKKVYDGEGIPKLSDFKGKSECAEQAALGKYLLQRIGVESAYVSGIGMQDANDSDEYPEEHSFLVMKNPKHKGGTLIFDIARPHSQKSVSRILDTDVPMTYKLLQNHEELLVGATDVLGKGGRLWFGVGEPVAGKHTTISEVPTGQKLKRE